MAIACVDWRDVDRERLAALDAAEIRRWSDVLGWDTASSWDQIELGRRLGTVSGLCALDAAGALAGWTFFLRHRDVLQVGGFRAASEGTTAALLDGILASDAATLAHAVTFFAFTDAPGLTDALAHRGLTVVRYDYLTKPLVAEPHTPSPGVRSWRTDDARAVARLLASAYPMPDEGRPFAPRGTAEEWQEYVGQIVSASGCGTIMPDASFVAPNGRDGLAGAILVTRLAAATAHVAQIAVDPAAERRGVGRLLIGAACANAREAGCTRMTLLVDDRNVRARRLYAHAGFVAVAGFVSAGTRNLKSELRSQN
jgi:ribosomal protein S18 acetylase RimI-like enzyme